MSASNDEVFPTDPVRRLKVWRTLRAEGVVEKKPIASYTKEDFDQIDARILLEDMASQDGVSVDQMLDGSEAERTPTMVFGDIDDFLEMLKSA